MGCEGLLRTARDASSVAPNLAESWEFSEDGTVMTLHLREGLKWSDGEPFTADDILFWYEDVLQNEDITPAISAFWRPGGELMKLEKVDDYTVTYTSPAPNPLILLFDSPLRGTQPSAFQPKHWMQQFHPKYTPQEELDALAKAEGFENWWQLYTRKASTIWGTPLHTILLHRDISKDEARRQAIEMLHLVNMPEPERTIDRYPHELSGGMRQRAMIAMALSCRPKLLIADEPTTALDVTTQAQILRIMRRLQDELGMAIMFITHDLGVIAQMADHVVVMYLGQIVESADVKTLFAAPKHPYTQALLRSVPRLGHKTVAKKTERLMAIEGSAPDPYSTPQACPFHPRCAQAIPGVCDQEDPPVVEVNPGHAVRCVLYQ